MGLFASTPIVVTAENGTSKLSPPIQRNQPALPAEMCALVNLKVVCYEVENAVPHQVSPDSAQATDFAIAPDRQWVAYRVGTTIAINTLDNVPLDGTTVPLTIDSSAPLPSAIDPILTTLTWSPDGLCIAYVISTGFRLAFPPVDGLLSFIDQTDRPYLNLRFSPGGYRLAAQASDSSWRIFAVDSDKHALHPIRTIDQASDLAWIDDGSFVVAYLSGGLARFKSDDPAAAALWTVPDQHYIKLTSTSSGQVMAINPDPGDTIGSAVSIDPDGSVKSLGDSKIDSRVRWGPDGRMMVYIASGTPILVDRGTGAEDMLPVKGISRLVWALPPAPEIVFTQLDSDLYYLAPQTISQTANNRQNITNIRQVWRFAKGSNGQREQVTHELFNVDDYALSADHSQLAYTSTGRLITVKLSDQTQQKLLAIIPYQAGQAVGAQPVWRPDGKALAFRSHDGIYLVSSDISEDDSARPTLIVPDRDGKHYTNPRYSPDGSQLLIEQHSDNTSSNSSDGTQTRNDCGYVLYANQKLTELPDCPEFAMWGTGDSAAQLLVRVKGIPKLLDSTTLSVTSQAVPLVNWPVVDARFAADGKSILLLKNIGWQSGPQVLQLYRVNRDGSGLTPVGRRGILRNANLSLTGQLASGVERIGTMEQIVLLNLQSGQKFRLQGTTNTTDLWWVQ